MKRDLDLCRKVMLEIEKSPTIDERIELHIEGYTEEQIEYNLLQLHKAGLVELDGQYIHEDYHHAIGLTPVGHDFLDKARDNNIWKKALKKVGDTAFPVLLQTLIELGRTETMKHLSQ